MMAALQNGETGSPWRYDTCSDEPSGRGRQCRSTENVVVMGDVNPGSEVLATGDYRCVRIVARNRACRFQLEKLMRV